MIIYHSPNASDSDFIRFLEDTVEELIIKRECIAVGNFNIDFMMDSFYTKKLQTTMLRAGMKQYVDKPTRITKDSRIIIDLIVANKKLDVQVIHEPKITDHAWLKVGLNGCKQGNRECSARNYSEFEIDKFIRLVENKLERNHSLDVNARATKFVDNIVEALDIVGQCRIPKIWEGKKWFSDKIREATAGRDEA